MLYLAAASARAALRRRRECIAPMCGAPTSAADEDLLPWATCAGLNFKQVINDYTVVSMYSYNFFFMRVNEFYFDNSV